MHFRIILLALLVLMVVSSCRKKADLAGWDADATMPLAYGTLNLAHYMPEDYITPGSGTLLNLVASTTLLNLGLDTLIGIPDTTIKEGFTNPSPFQLTLFPGQVFYDSVKTSVYKIQNVKLTYAIIRESTVEITMKNSINKPVLFQYKILNATRNGDTFSIEQRVEASSTFKGVYNLNGYELNLRGINGQGYNTIVSHFRAMIHPSLVGPQVIPGLSSFNIENTVRNVTLEYVQGYFGSQQIEFNSTAYTDLLSQFPFKKLDITDFFVTMTLDNGIGADLQLMVNRLGTATATTGATANLSHALVGSTQNLSRAVNLWNPLNPVKHIQKQFNFNRNNSNLDKLIELRPDSVHADLSLTINPLGNISLGNDFVYYGHNLRLSMDMIVPLTVSLGGLELLDTVPFSFTMPQNKGVDRFNFGTLRIITDNGYPLEADLEFFLMDSTDSLLQPLLGEPIRVEGALEEPSGLVLNPRRSEVEIPVTRPLLEVLEKTSRIRVRAVVNTTGENPVRLRSNARIDFRIVADINFKVQE